MSEAITRDRLVAAALVLLSIAAQWTLHDRAVVPMDEGHLAAAADWMLDGKRLYRDIHTGIFPGVYLLTSALFALFGEDLLTTRLAAVVMNASTTLALWLVSRRMARLHWALLPPVLHVALVALSFPVLSMFNYSTLAVCFALWALVFLLRYLEQARTPDAVTLGLFVAAAALTKQNFGFLAFVSLLAGLLACRRSSAIGALPAVRALGPIALSGAGLTLALAVYFVATGTLGHLLESTVLSLAGSQMQDFNNPLPPLFGPHPEDDIRFIFLYSPPPVFNAMVHGEALVGWIPITPALRSCAIRLTYGLPIAAVLASLPILWLTRTWDTPDAARATRCATLFAVVFFPGIFPSAIWSHLAFVLVPVLLLFAFLGDRAESWLARRGGTFSRAGVPILRGVAGAVVLAQLVLGVRFTADVARWNDVALELPRATLRVSERMRGLLGGSVAFVEGCAGPDEPILALPDIPIVYFLTDRPNPTPYDLTIPGHVDGALIARSIDAVPIRCIVFNPQMYPEFPAFKQLFPGLAQRIEQRFRGEVMIEGGGSRWIGLVRRSR